MSKKKKIKINVESEETAENENTEKSVPANDEYDTLKDETGDDSGAEVKDPVKELEARLESKAEEAKETYDRLLRVTADFENYKKRSTREMEEFRKYANQSLLKEMLSVVDNLELAINSSNDEKESDKSLIEGLNLTLSEILRVLEKFNVTPIEARGKTFDPAFHEAVMREETDDFPEKTVVSEFQKGYLIHDRLLRPAMVVVAVPKKPKKNKPEKTD
ncbi:MAG: nucleotide exchange factor GrpE [Desulfobacterales bacterium]|jgi:molecular chaperone GrpE